MGAAGSTLATSGDKGGKFQLTTDQQRRLDIVSNLFQALLTENNMMALVEKINTSEDACNDLIITLSNELDKEFQRLRFTNPAKSGESTTVGYISEAEYRAIQSKGIRLEMCKQIASFLLKFVILVAALTSSIAIMESVPELVRVEEVWAPKDMSAIPSNEFAPKMLDYLQDIGIVKKQVSTKFPNVEVYSFFDEYNIHYKGVIYTRKSPSKIFQISIDYARPEMCSGMSSVGPMSSMGGPSIPYGSSGTSGTSGSPASSFWGVSPVEEKRMEYESQRAIEKLQEKYKKEAENAERKLQEEKVQKEKSRLETIAKIAELKFEATRYLNSDAFKKGKQDIIDLLAKINTLKSQTNKKLVLNNDQQKKMDMIQTKINELNSAETKLQTDFIEKPNELIKLNEIQSQYDKVKGLINFQESKETLDAMIPKSSTGGANDFLHITITELSSNGSRSNTFAQPQYPTPSMGSPMPSTGLSPSPSSEFSSMAAQPPSSGPRPSPISNNISSISPSPSMGGFVNQGDFVMDVAGNTWDKDFYCKMGGRVTKDQRSIPVRRRLADIFANTNANTLTADIVNIAGENGVSSNSSTFDVTDMTLHGEPVKQIINLLKNKYGIFLGKSASQIQSPAAQRAFNLFRSVIPDSKNPTMQIAVCNDPWKDKSLNGIPAYALFTALYKITKDAATPSAFKSDKMEYADLMNDKVRLLCKDGIPLTGAEGSTARKEVQQAYRKLQQLYATHLEAVVKKVYELFVIDQDFITTLAAPSGFQTSKPIFRLNPIFATASGDNSDVVLDRKIKEVREMLDRHYAEVETTYTTAIKNLGNPAATTTGGKRWSTRRRLHGRKAGQRRHISLRKKRGARV